MWIKICANTNLHDAQLAAELGADAVGFVLAPSKREVFANELTEMVDGLPEETEKAGVFAIDDAHEVALHVIGCGLTVVQLHRRHDDEMVRLIADECGGELKIIQVVMFDVANPDHTAVEERFTADLKAVLADKHVWAVLIDASKGKASGGLGVSFDWKRVGNLVRAANSHNKRVILAGGLTPENVAEAIHVFKPWGVDVASGVEASPGKKDWQRLATFIAAARAAGELAADTQAGVP